MAEDFLLRLTAHAGAFAFFDLPSKLEAFALGSFSCCLLGSMSAAFPLPQNIGIALLALIACRGYSEAQLAATTGFCLFTTITDFILMCANPTGWGGAMTILNILLKLAMAAHAYRMCDQVGALAEGMATSVEGDATMARGGTARASGAYPAATYHAPAFKDDDYSAAMPSADDASDVEGEARTRYRAI